MASKLITDFVKGLAGAFCKLRMLEETRSIYIEKLSRWRLSEKQWNQVLDRLIEQNESGEMPALAAIYPNIRAVQLITEGKSDLGWMSFDLNGTRRFVRIKNLMGKWTLAPCEYTGPNREKIVLQKNPGAPAIPPVGATKISYYPDSESQREMEPECEEAPK